LKDNPATRLIPFVLITGLTDSSDKVRGIEAGADDFLNKPVLAEELIARVKSLLRLKEFTDVVNQDISGGKIIQKTYSFDKVSLNLFLPKFSSQASRLVGVTLHGTNTFIARDASGNWKPRMLFSNFSKLHQIRRNRGRPEE